jgi:hypothetical protein
MSVERAHWRRVKRYLKENSYTGPLVEAVQAARRTQHRLVSDLRRAAIARHYTTISKQRFIEQLQRALATSTGYAAGKIGRSNQIWMHYPRFLQMEHSTDMRRKFEDELVFHGLRQMGVFPGEARFYLAFNEFYMGHVRNIDSLGICYIPGELELIKYYKLSNDLMWFVDQEPDKSAPNDDRRCYLPLFRDRKILVICPFAGFLRERATRDVFEQVWSKTGKKWFYPSSVEALEFPYGFSSDTHSRYPTVFQLFDEVAAEIEKRDFDIALIGAAGLAIPFASFVKNLGKIAIDLGGALQILFGVSGRRWANFEELKRDIFNEHWTYLPPRYLPKERNVCDNLAYWQAPSRSSD